MKEEMIDVEYHHFIISSECTDVNTTHHGCEHHEKRDNRSTHACHHLGSILAQTTDTYLNIYPFRGRGLGGQEDMSNVTVGQSDISCKKFHIINTSE